MCAYVLRRSWQASDSYPRSSGLPPGQGTRDKQDWMGQERVAPSGWGQSDLLNYVGPGLAPFLELWGLLSLH